MLRNIRVLTWFNFFTEFKLYAPIAILYFTQVSGSYALGMSIFSIVMVSSALFEIPTGIFSDKIGRKKTMILGAICAVTFVTLYSIGINYLVLVIGALVEGLTRALYSGNNDALLYDTLLDKNSESSYAEFLGKTSSMIQVALALSAVMGGIILLNWNFKAIFWLSIIPQVISFMLVLRLIEPKIKSKKSGNVYKHLKEAYLGFIKNRKLRLLSITSVISYGLGDATYQFQAAFYATVWPAWAIPFAKVFANIGSALSYHYSGRVLKRFNVFDILLFGQFYNRTATIISAIISNVFSPIVYSSSAFLYGIHQVGRNDLMQKEFSHERRATMGSLNSFAGSILFGIAAILLGFLADKFSPAQSIIVLQIILSINIIVFYKLFKSYRASA